MNTISTCIIVKNEIDNLPLLVEDLKQVSDQIVLVDTGSTDGTVEWILNQACQDPRIICRQFEWVSDFSIARNYSFSWATMDWIFWCDADDRISPELISDIQNWKYSTIAPEVNAFVMYYQFSKELIVPRIRLISRACNPIWYGACHEYLDSEVLNSVDFPSNSLIIHQRKHGHAKRNLDIFLEKWLRADEFSTRDAYYFVQELGDNGYQNRAELLALDDIYNYWYVDSWNAINRILFNRWVSKNLPYEGIEVIKRLSESHSLRGDILYIYGYLHQMIGDLNQASTYYVSAIMTEVSGLERHLELVDRSKVLPAIELYNMINDDNMKNMLVDHIKKYISESSIAYNFINTL